MTSECLAGLTITRDSSTALQLVRLPEAGFQAASATMTHTSCGDGDQSTCPAMPQPTAVTCRCTSPGSARIQVSNSLTRNWSKSIAMP